jgi:hypothetical protein
MRCRALWSLMLAVGLGAAVGLAAQGVDWTPGVYWTYQVRAAGERDPSISFPEMTFYVVAARSVLWVEVYALAQFSDGPEGFLQLIPCLEPPGGPVPQGWPLLIEHRPGLPGEPGFLIFYSTAPLPGEGTRQYTETVQPLEVEPEEAQEWLEAMGPAGEAMEEALKEGKIREWREVAETQPEDVTVPAGTFNRCRTVQYRAHYGYGATEEGTAWWSSEVGWWVRLEGNKTFGDKANSYIIELVDWGQLSHEELTGRLATALQDTAVLNPALAETVRSQLQELGIEIPDR